MRTWVIGSKGTSQQTQAGTSSYTPAPQIMAAGNQALGQASQAATSPFQLPTAPVAGFTPDQLRAFQQTQQQQGFAQPYYNQAQGLFNQSAAPISAGQISQYMNPYASSVLANLQETQGQQMQDLTGRTTQAAGGVGADRIGVAQGELARQQNLATGQTLSGIYGSALSAAQQDAQRQQAAAYGIGNLGGAAQNAAMQGTQALYGQGAIQQQLKQAQMNAPYQNTLARIAYPYQQAQYLSGITGSLAGPLGGTTTSNQFGTTTPAQPSIWSQIAGAGTAGVGALGATGAFGNNGWMTGGGKGSNAGTYNLGDLGGGGFPSGYTTGNYASGGEVEQSYNSPYQIRTSDGQHQVINVQTGQIHYSGTASGAANAQATLNSRRFADGGEVSREPSWMTADPTIPTIAMHASPINQPKITPLNMSSGKDSGGIGGDIANIAKTVATIAPLFLAQGGAVETTPYQGYADGGDTFDDRFDTSGMGEMTRAEALAHYMRQPATYFKSAYAGPDPQLLPQEQARSVAAPTTRFTVNPQENVINPGDPHRLPSVRADGSPIVPPDQMRADETSEAAGPKATGLRALSPAAADTAEQNAAAMDIRRSSVPYSDLDPTRDVSRGFAKSPWLALINAGAGMMAGTSPYAGVNIGKGLQAGTETLGKQREASREEESVNQRAQQLALEAEKHRDSLTKMTPYQAGTLEQSQSTLKLQKLYENPIDGTTLYMNHGTGKIEKYGPNGAEPITPADKITAASKGIKVASADDTGVGSSPAYQGDTASTSIAPPNSQIITADPNAMISNPVKPSQAAERNNDVLQGYTSKPAAAAGRASANIERKDINKLASGADKSQYRLAEMQRDLDTIMAFVNKNPNGAVEKALQFAIKPGPGAEGGVALSNFMSKFGGGLPPEVQAAANTWGKNATLAGFAGIVGEGLSAREAQPIIRASMNAVANIGLPEASNRALIASGRELAQRSKDQQAFFDSYLAKNGGISIGWRDEFEKKFPIGSYIARAVVSALPPTERAKLGADTQLLRQTRDQYMAAEKSGDPKAIASAMQTYNQAKAKFNMRYGGTADYFAFGRIM